MVAYGWPIDLTVGELLDRRQVSTTFRKAPKVKDDGAATLPMAME